MKAPLLPSYLTLIEGECQGPYPPKGFIPIQECDFGNGDYMGLYWPFGSENEMPLVCRMAHDEYYMDPVYSSLDTLLRISAEFEFKADDPEIILPNSLLRMLEPGDEAPPFLRPDGEEARLMEVIRLIAVPTLADDPHSPSALVQRANLEIENGEFDLALPRLEKAISILPEFTDAWVLKTVLHRRRRDEYEAAHAAMRSILCPPWFGWQADVVVQHFKRMPIPDSLQDDPLLKRRAELSLFYHRDKTNNDYPIMKECIDEYLAMGRPMEAVLLHQKYGALMVTEVPAFQERYRFSEKEFKRRQNELFVQHFGDAREAVVPFVAT